MRDVEDRHEKRRYHWLPGVILLLVVIIVAVGARTISYVESHLVDSTGKTLALMAGEIADQLDATLYERYGDIQVLGKALRPYLDDPAAMTQRLLQFHDLYATYEWLAMTDARGRVVAATDPASVGLDKGGTDWFLAARRAPGVHLTDVSRFDEIGGGAAVGFTAAITDADGRFVGTVTSRVALTKVEDIFRHTVDRLKAQHETPLRIEWQFMTRNGDLITDSMLREEWKVNLQRLGLPSALQISTASEPGYVEERHLRMNVDVITGYAHTQGYLEFPGFQWGILVRVEREEILQPVHALTRTLGFLLIGMVGPVLALLIWAFTRLRGEWEAAVRTSQRLSATLASVEDAVIMIDPQGRIAVVNPAAETLTGWSRHAATGQLWQSCLALRGATHDEQRALDELVSDVLTQGSAKHLPPTATLVRLGEEVRPVEGSAIPVRDAQQQPIGLVLTLRDLSERREREATLVEASLRFQALLESAQDAIVIADEHGLIRSWNTAGTRLFGYAPEEIVGQPLTRLMPERYRDPHNEGFKRVRSNGGIGPGRRLEAEALRKDGREFPVECTLSTWNKGTAHYFCGILRDRTERMHHERRLAVQYGITQALASSPSLEDAAAQICETMCRLLNMDLAVLWLVDPAADVLRCRMIWPPDHRSGEPFASVSTAMHFSRGVGLPGRVWATSKVAWLPDVSADGNFPRLAPALQAGIRSGFALPIHSHDQILGVLEFFSKADTAPDAILLDMFQGIGSQIGQFIERRQAKQALRLSEAALVANQRQLQAILDYTSAVIVLKDLQGRYLLVNRQYETLFRVTQESITGKTDYDLFPAAMAQAFQGTDAQALAALAPISVEELVPQDDGPHTYLAIKFPLYDDAGHPYAICGIATDITERQQLEAQLHQAQKMEAIGRLASSVAHDFNNMLTVIAGNNRLLREELPPDHPGHALVADIAEASDRAAHLTAQLLTFSRKQQVQPQRLDLSQRLTMVERLLLRLIGEDVTVGLVPGAPGSLIVMDPTQLEQVILNLAINARDAMPQGGRLTIEAGPVDLQDSEPCSHGTLTPGAYVRLRVTDTGMGMTADTLAHCFEPFFTTKAQGAGTGLGLATVYGILAEHHGVMDVTSRPSHGTCFTLYFPRVQGMAAGSDEVPAQPAARGGAETVLLVEDDRAVRTWLKKVLTRAGYRVLEAPDGAQALQCCRDHPGPIHLLLTDMVMPGLSGPEVADQLTRDRPELRVLYMSGYSDHPIFREAGAALALLQKPFTPEQVLEKIRRVLDAPLS